MQTIWMYPLGPNGKKARLAMQVLTAEETQDAVTFARERLGFPLDKSQEAILGEGRRAIINCTRQYGKSTVGAIKALHRAYTKADCLILVLSPTLRQSGEFGVSQKLREHWCLFQE